MKLKAILLTAIVVFSAFGVYAIAADYGTQSDPLVSLSYITDVFAPDLLNQAKRTAESAANTANTNVKNYEARVDKKINEFTDRNTAEVNDAMVDKVVSKVPVPETKQSAPFATLELAKGKTLVLSKGCELLVRSGNASCKAGSLVDTTTGGALSAGGAISTNHLYITSDSVTITIKSNSTILVKGQYSAY